MGSPTTNSSTENGATANQRPAAEAVAYQGEPLPNVPEDLVVPGILSLDFEERLWVPQAPDVWFRPILFNVSQGYFVNLLRVRRSGILSRHRHSGPVHATVLKGRWHYLEHDWWATEGSHAFEPPATSTPSKCQMGTPLGVEDVFSKLASAKAHYEKVGLGSDYVDQFIR
ncbi:hypothetical protein N7460_003468 [Penicillium canescens]|uniref:ChrR-like cupin domain-containing protein n=1 Tax=Penicillium canescens TaxID=5083 RepID=A0AAD6IH72_PENCN|nr:hypothetical protein N7444_011875 [Penicillium canescens]KAJ6047321.1 hypothetical protein N7460_003468 [Penicillium canescens]